LVADAGTMLRRLRPRFGSQFKISINLSRRLLAAEAGPFLNLLSNCHIPPERLTLEVPESIVGRDGKALARTLARVRPEGETSNSLAERLFEILASWAEYLKNRMPSSGTAVASTLANKA